MEGEQQRLLAKEQQLKEEKQWLEEEKQRLEEEKQRLEGKEQRLEEKEQQLVREGLESTHPRWQALLKDKDDLRKDKDNLAKAQDVHRAEWKAYILAMGQQGAQAIRAGAGAGAGASAGPPRDAFTARELLSMRLPDEWPSAVGVTENKLEAAFKAFCARPAQVQVWEEYNGQLLEICILQHIADADNTDYRYQSLPRDMCPVRGDGKKERHVQSALETGPLERLNRMLLAIAGMDGYFEWVPEMTMQVCETLAQHITAAPGAATISALEAGMAAAAAAPMTAPEAGAVAVALELGASAVAVAVAPGTVQAPTGRPRRTASCSAPLHSASGTSVHSASGTSASSRVRADFALVWKSNAQPQGPSTTRKRQLAVASSSSATAAMTPDAHPPNHMNWQQAAHKYVAMSEVKRYEKLFREGKPLDLCKLWHKRSESGQTGESDEESKLGASVRHMLDQLFTYFVLTGVPFGWFSCFYAIWLVWRPLDKPDCLMLSRPFLHSEEGPTAMAALSWLQAEAVTHWRDGKRHEQVSLQMRGMDYSPCSESHGSPSPHEDFDDESRDPSWKPQQGKGKDQGASKRRRRETSSGGGVPTSAMPLLSADDIVLGDKIGEGSTSQVVQGLYGRQPAAIKLLLGPGDTARVEREAAMFQVLADAQAHGAIPTLFGRGTLRLGTPFLATSLVKGEPLSEVGCPPPGAYAAAKRALEAIHSAGVAHGDVELCNMMLEELPCTSAASSTDTSMAPPEVLSGEGGGGGSSTSESAAEEWSCRIKFIDLGRAYTGATPDQLNEEMRKLRRLLRYS